MKGLLRRLVAEHIRNRRLEKGLSQEKLAELCGLHRTYVGGIERAERNITLGTLEVICSALDVSPIDLLQNKAEVGTK